jgi:hypothetical protein
MKLPAKPEAKEPFIVMQFYHSQTFPYLVEKWQAVISRRLKDVPTSLRHQELVPALVALGETSGDTAWQLFRNYLDKIEHCLAEAELLVSSS